MESRPHHPRPRPRPHLPRPRPLKSETETETQYLSCQIFFYTKKTSFFTGDIGIYRRPSTFFMPLFFICFFFRSCGLDRVVLRETELFEPLNLETETRRDRDLWETRPRQAETQKIRSRNETRSRDLHHWVDLNEYMTMHHVTISRNSCCSGLSWLGLLVLILDQCYHTTHAH